LSFVGHASPALRTQANTADRNTPNPKALQLE